MKLGIIGLPNAGKSSLFNILTDASAQAEAYPFTTIDANHGMAPLADPILVQLGRLLSPDKLTYSQIEVVDVAGLIKGAHAGEGLGNQFLANIRDVDLIINLIRVFDDASVPHVFQAVDPFRDKEIILSELALADLDIVERRLNKARKKVDAADEIQLLDRYHDHLSESKFSLNGSYNDQDLQFLTSIGLLIPRPRIDVLNMSDSGRCVRNHQGYKLSVALENGLADFSDEEKKELRTGIYADERGPSGLVEEACRKLDLIRFYTIKGKEVRAWLVRRGITAHQAAEKIHTDLADGFIKAEVVAARDLIKAGSWHHATEAGKLKVEGKDYTVQDGDVLLVKFR